MGQKASVVGGNGILYGWNLTAQMRRKFQETFSKYPFSKIRGLPLRLAFLATEADLSYSSPDPTLSKVRPMTKTLSLDSGSGCGRVLSPHSPFLISLFQGGLNIYEVHNNSAWYNFGYLMGLICIFGGGGHKARWRP
jgi:hypothetical protein